MEEFILIFLKTISVFILMFLPIVITGSWIILAGFKVSQNKIRLAKIFSNSILFNYAFLDLLYSVNFFFSSDFTDNFKHY